MLDTECLIDNESKYFTIVLQKISNSSLTPYDWSGHFLHIQLTWATREVVKHLGCVVGMSWEKRDEWNCLRKATVGLQHIFIL